MKPPAGVIATQPTMIAVAAPIAVTLRPRIRSRANQTTSVQAGQQQGVGEGEHARVAGREAAAAVEAEPAEPEQAGAEQHVDRVVGEERLAAVVLAGADDQRRRQGREAGAHLDRDAAGEVEGAAGLQPAAAEGPVGEHGVDEHRPERGEDEEGAEAHPLDHRAGDQRDGDDAEGRLEGHEDELAGSSSLRAARSRRR